MKNDDIEANKDNKLANIENNALLNVPEQSHVTSNAGSVQMQLLNLAKSFVLDGAVLSNEKQRPIEERCTRRERVSAIRKQKNLESIVKATLSYCASDEIGDKIDPDWFNRFTYLAEGVSNKTMQGLWAKILAGEIAQPGSFSLKSLKIFKDLSITEAKLLSKACAIAVKDSHKKNARLISGAYQPPNLWNFLSKNTQHTLNLNNYGLSYTELLTLAENHLIFIQESESHSFEKNEQIQFNFNGQPLTFQAAKSNAVIKFYKFTPAGSELASLIGDNPNTDYKADLKQTLQTHFSIMEK